MVYSSSFSSPKMVNGSFSVFTLQNTWPHTVETSFLPDFSNCKGCGKCDYGTHTHTHTHTNTHNHAGMHTINQQSLVMAPNTHIIHTCSTVSRHMGHEIEVCENAPSCGTAGVLLLRLKPECVNRHRYTRMHTL